MDFKDKVALVTGGANGLGRGTAEALINRGAKVVLADIEDDTGRATAAEIGAEFIHTDVTDPAASQAAVEFAKQKFGRLDLAFLNAGISTGCGLDQSFDLDRYRTAMGVNLDGVVFGLNAAIPAMREAGGGSIVCTASLAGLAPTPFDPIYAANKAAVVGLVRSVGPVYDLENIHVNGICPGFADTRIVDPIKEGLTGEGIPIIPVEQVVDGIMDLFGEESGGHCHFVQHGMETQELNFRRVPGPRPVAEAA